MNNISIGCNICIIHILIIFEVQSRELYVGVISAVGIFLMRMQSLKCMNRIFHL